jgi:hypothetical protein
MGAASTRNWGEWVNKIFLAYSFRPEQPARVQLIQDIARLVRSHDLVPLDGRIAGGKPLGEAVPKLIADSHALIAVFTREEKLAKKGAWLPTQWVQDEFASAHAKDHRTIALIEEGVKRSGAFSDDEYIKLDIENPREALVRLSETLCQWKSEAGRFLMVRLLPEEAAKLAANGMVKCNFRLVLPRGPAGGWQEGMIRPQPGGVFLAVPGVPQDASFEVQILDGAKICWKSNEFPQWVHVELQAVP